MRAAFKKLNTDRQEEILNACINEFAKNGYQNASTNQIVKQAGISKGTLFNYFGSKKELYLSIVEVVVERYTKYANELKALSAEESTDLFERLKERGFRKLQIALSHPELYAILYDAFVGLEESMKKEVLHRMASMSRAAEDTLKVGLDTSVFKSDVDVDKAIEITQMFLEGYFQRKQGYLKSLGLADSLKVYSEMVEDCDSYLVELRKVFYK